jgi:hypothetical protein
MKKILKSSKRKYIIRISLLGFFGAPIILIILASTGFRKDLTGDFIELILTNIVIVAPIIIMISKIIEHLQGQFTDGVKKTISLITFILLSIIYIIIYGFLLQNPFTDLFYDWIIIQCFLTAMSIWYFDFEPTE